MASCGVIAPARYPLLAPVGHGGQAMVWRTRDHKKFSLFPLVIKFLHPRFMHDKAARNAFAREAQVMASGGEAWGPRLYESVTQAEHPYLVREYSVGVPLRPLERNIPRNRVLLWLRDIAQALSRLHASGWIHGDVKPSNIICRAHAPARLVDFGSAYPRFDMAHDPAPWSGWQAPVWGSKDYQPHQEDAGNAASYDTRRDLFALAVMVHEVFVGRHPFRGGREPEFHPPTGISKTVWRRIVCALALDPAVRRNGPVWMLGGQGGLNWPMGRGA